jgi:transposase
VALLEDYGFDPHLVHPLRCKAIASARLKNDKVDAAILAQLLRADLLPEAWIAPSPVRQLRALLRHRAQLVRLRTLLRNRIHAVLADHGHDRPAGCWSGPGRAWLACLELPAISREVVDDELGLIDAVEARIDRLDWEIRQRARSDPRVKILTLYRFRTRPGVVTCSLAGCSGWGRIAACVFSSPLSDHDPGLWLAATAGPQAGVQGRGDHGAPS